MVNGPNRLEIEGTKEILDIINNLKRQLTMGRSFAYSRLQRKYNFAKNRTGGSVRENVHSDAEAEIYWAIPHHLGLHSGHRWEMRIIENA